MNIFCIGIGGIGLSAVAQILQSQGHELRGSDLSQTELTEHLMAKDIQVFHEHNEKNITKDLDFIIYSEAVPESNPERKKADEIGIHQISYAEALGMISKDRQTIAITGTHGKTTVTGMLTNILLAAEKDPTIVIGSKMEILDNQNFRVGESKIFLTEACEYRNNFQFLNPNIVLVNNLEPDHLDYFKTEENYYQTFQNFLEKVPSSGSIILLERDEEKIHWQNISAHKVVIPEEICRREIYSLKVPGQHNKRNAHAAEAVAQALGVQDQFIKKGLEEFKGTWRRFEYKGTVNGAKIYDDYGHHPTEIKATLQGAREWFPDKKLIIIFQPHQFSRTRVFWNEFLDAFSDASEAWITDIYEARDSEEDKKAVSAEGLSQAISKPRARYIPLGTIPEEIIKQADPYTIYLVMGAGNITQQLQKLQFDENEKRS